MMNADFNYMLIPKANTGKKTLFFHTIKEAATFLGIKEHTISDCLHNGSCCNGYYVDYDIDYIEF